MVVASPDSSHSAGRLATARWLAERLLRASAPTWHVEVKLDVRKAIALPVWDAFADTRFHIDIHDDEWGFFFCHGGKTSWIRVDRVACVHVRDDHQLVASAPSLKNIGTLLRQLERTHGIELQRQLALVRTDLVGAEQPVRQWIASL